MKPRHVFVVGASSGVGLALATRLTQRRVLLSTAGRRAPTSVPGHHEAVDLASADWSSLLARAEDGAGAPVDGVVFVAGTAVFGRTPDVPVDEARATFELNYFALAAAATAAAQRWTERRAPGIFVGVLSIAARRAIPYEAHYAASKAAASRFLESLDLEYEGTGARFLAVYPGVLTTPFLSKARWHGMAPTFDASRGTDPDVVAARIVEMLTRPAERVVVGVRERLLDLADRVSPTLYDRLVLRPAVRRRRANANTNPSAG